MGTVCGYTVSTVYVRYTWRRARASESSADQASACGACAGCARGDAGVRMSVCRGEHKGTVACGVELNTTMLHLQAERLGYCMSTAGL